MQLECWTIQGESFHFGRHGLGQEQTMVSMPSDSLFGALVACLARTQGAQATERFCQPFREGDPSFVLSSTFPFAGGARFFPVPLSARSGEAQGVDPKRLKRIRFVSEGVFRTLLKGTALAAVFDEKWTLQGGELLANEADFALLPPPMRKPSAKVWTLEQRPRVTLDRSSSISNFFHIGQVHFERDCGLWFAVSWRDARRKDEFKALLHELAQAGFGAERSVGLGIASVEGPKMLDLPDATHAWVTLSRYLPTEEEGSTLTHPGSVYALKTVGGWLDSPVNMGQRRRSVNLLEEGSVFGSPSQRAVPGRVVDVRPSYPGDPDPLGHPVYRCGLALAVGMEGGAA